MMAKLTYRLHWFWKHGVLVKVPIQKPDIKPKRLEIPAGIPMSATPGVFRPLRQVINLKIVEVNHPSTVVTKFTPSITIRVRYDQKDLNAAKNAGGDLSLGYWDGTHWNRFTATHHFRLEGWSKKEEKGWATVEISSWADPTIALGT
jgi:hypothetical protein